MNGYDSMAREYLASRNELKSDKYVRKFLRLLPKKSLVLDLGCGGGVPVDDLILRAGHEVIGIDSSQEMVKRARWSCPGGEYRVGDISKLNKREYEVEGVVSMYAMFHIPRVIHERVLRTVAGYLPVGGPILLSMGDVEYEGWHELYGEKVWSSQWDAKKNRDIVEQVGFEILLDEMDYSGGERHQVLIGTKR